MSLNLPLMRNNITRADLDAVIAHLQQEDPILTQSSNVRAFEEEWSNDLTRAIQLKNLGFLPSSQITGIRLKLPSIAITWMRAICGVGNLGKFMLSRGQCEEADATCNIYGVVKLRYGSSPLM